MCLSNFKAMRQFKVPISWLRDFTRSYEKTSFRILRRGSGSRGMFPKVRYHSCIFREDAGWKSTGDAGWELFPSSIKPLPHAFKSLLLVHYKGRGSTNVTHLLMAFPQYLQTPKHSNPIHCPLSILIRMRLVIRQSKLPTCLVEVQLAHENILWHYAIGLKKLTDEMDEICISGKFSVQETSECRVFLHTCE